MEQGPHRPTGARVFTHPPSCAGMPARVERNLQLKDKGAFYVTDHKNGAARSLQGVNSKSKSCWWCGCVCARVWFVLPSAPHVPFFLYARESESIIALQSNHATAQNPGRSSAGAVDSAAHWSRRPQLPTGQAPHPCRVDFLRSLGVCSRPGPSGRVSRVRAKCVGGAWVLRCCGCPGWLGSAGSTWFAVRRAERDPNFFDNFSGACRRRTPRPTRSNRRIASERCRVRCVFRCVRIGNGSSATAVGVLRETEEKKRARFVRSSEGRGRPPSHESAMPSAELVCERDRRVGCT